MSNFQVDVFRHALDQAMRTAQGCAAAEHQQERRGVGRSDRRQGLDDMPVLLDERRARQAEMRLDFQQGLEMSSLKDQLRIPVPELP